MSGEHFGFTKEEATALLARVERIVGGLTLLAEAARGRFLSEMSEAGLPEPVARGEARRLAVELLEQSLAAVEAQLEAAVGRVYGVATEQPADPPPRRTND